MAHARIIDYRVMPDAVEEILQLANREMVPIYQAQPGFQRGYIIQTGEGEILAVSLWASPEQAEEGHRVLGGWVREHLAHAVLSAERRMGTVLSSVEANI